MALEHILAAIEGDADDAVAAVRREAKRARKQLQASAEEDRIRAIEEVHAAAHQKSEAATRAIAQEGERQLLERRLAWRRQEVESLLEGLAHELAALRHDPPRHEQLSQHLAREALAALPDATVARIDPRDETLLQPILQGLTVEPHTTTWGGLVLDAGDGRRVDNRLETRLTAQRREILALLAHEDAFREAP